jgi:hypothetical protein
VPDPIFRSGPDYSGEVLTVEAVHSERAREQGAVAFIDAGSMGMYLNASDLAGLIDALQSVAAQVYRDV